jgi:hypothetical protein
MINSSEQVVYKEPRISLNKLGEYLTTSKASRRERILLDAKYPPTFQVIRYDPTRYVIQRFLSGKIANTAALAEAINDYALTKTKDDFEARMKKSNLEAMERFAAMAPGLTFGDAKVTAGPNAPQRRMVSGVSVSVRPDLQLTMGGGNVSTRRGAVKLNISKGAVHGQAAADYVGTLLRHYIDDECPEGECDHQLCFTLDVFGEKLSASPKATVNRMKDIEAGCGEIARQWDSIGPA